MVVLLGLIRVWQRHRTLRLGQQEWLKHWIVMALICAAFGQTTARSSYLRCFKKIVRHSVDNSQPIAELFNVIPDECMDQCILSAGNHPQLENKGRCRCFAYDHLQHSCRLYDHDGNKVPAIVHPGNGFDFYLRTATTQECSGPFQRLLALKRKVNGVRNNAFVSAEIPEHLSGFQRYRHKKIRYVDRSPLMKEMRREIRRKEALRGVRTNKKIGKAYDDNIRIVDVEKLGNNAALFNKKKSYRRKEIPKDTFYNNYEILATRKNEYNETIFKPIMSSDDEALKFLINASSTEELFTGNQTREKLYRISQEEFLCPSSDIGYFVTVGQQVTSDAVTMVTVYRSVDELDCANLCTANKGSSLKCRSFNYFLSLRICELYGTNFRRTEQLSTSNGSIEAIHAEKFCIPSQNISFTCNPNEQFILHPKKAFSSNSSSNSIKTVHSRSLTDCLSFCLENRKCQTASFDESTGECQVHRISVTDNAHLVEHSERMLLIENGCTRMTKMKPGRLTTLVDTFRKIFDFSFP